MMIENPEECEPGWDGGAKLTLCGGVAIADCNLDWCRGKVAEISCAAVGALDHLGVPLRDRGLGSRPCGGLSMRLLTSLETPPGGTLALG